MQTEKLPRIARWHALQYTSAMQANPSVMNSTDAGRALILGPPHARLLVRPCGLRPVLVGVGGLRRSETESARAGFSAAMLRRSASKRLTTFAGCGGYRLHEVNYPSSSRGDINLMLPSRYEFSSPNPPPPPAAQPHKSGSST